MANRATCLNCMDGRVQIPVALWIKDKFPVDFADVVTEAGMDGVLARREDLSEILRKVRISIDLNKSTRLFIVGHHDCKGNPVDEAAHRRDITDAVTRLKTFVPTHEIFGLWVNSEWQVEQISKTA